MSAAGAKHQFSVADYHEMLDRGILTERDRVELIRGEVVEKMPFGSLHIACVDRLTLLLILAVGKQAITSVQNPIVLADSEPEPDLVLKRPRADFYAADKVRPVDVLLAIEVSDSSLDFDRDVKGPLYAESGIVEYWIVNLIESCLEVHHSILRRKDLVSWKFGRASCGNEEDRRCSKGVLRPARVCKGC